MGLDMYLERSKKVNGLSINEIGILRDYIDWKESGNECSFMAWCGRHEAEVKTDYIDMKILIFKKLAIGEKQIKFIIGLFKMFKMELMIVGVMKFQKKI